MDHLAEHETCGRILGPQVLYVVETVLLRTLEISIDPRIGDVGSLALVDQTLLLFF